MLKRKTILTLTAIFALFIITTSAALAGNQLSKENHKEPVVLVHGYFGSILGMTSVDVYWAYYTTRLTMDGFKVYKIALPEGGILSDIPTSAQKLKEFVDDVRAKTGSPKVDIIAHSEGGLVSRYYIENLGGVNYVDDLITLATPHRGTSVASIGPGIASRQMEVYNDFLNKLNEGDNLPGPVEYSAIFSNNDEIVFPCENGFFQGAVNANVNLLGHGGIMFNEDVYQYAKGALTGTSGSDRLAVPIRIVKNKMTTNNPNVTLQITPFNHNYPGEDMHDMRIDNDKFVNTGDWRSISPTVSWKIDDSSDGLKGVYIQFRKGEGILGIGEKRSQTYVDYIFLDRTSPTGGVKAVQKTTTDPSVALDISFADNSDQYKTLQGWNFMIAYGIDDLGVKDMMISADPNFAGASWQPAAKSARVNVGATPGVKTVYLKLRDGAGNESKVYTDTVNVIDPTDPGASLVDESVRNPVVLVHGYMGSIVGDVSSYINWVYIYEKLKAEGYDVSRITLDDGALQDVRKSSAQLKDFIAAVIARTGASKVDIVCHSEGGLVARYYIQSLGGAPFVDDLVTFSTPWRGTTTATIGPGEASRQMEVGSNFIRDLDAPGLAPGIEYTALFSNADEVVVPGKNAFLKGALNINWNIYGHAGILFSPEPYNAMKTAISKKRVSATLPVKIEAPGMVTNAQSINVSFTPYNHFDPGKSQSQMIVSLDPLFRNASWEPVSANKTISLAGREDGIVGVHVKFKGASGIESPSYVDYIVLDRTPPEGAVSLVFADAVNKTAKISIKASDASDKYCCLNFANLLTSYGIRDIGLDAMQVSENADFTGASWEPIAAEKVVNLSPGSGQKNINVRFLDKAGNVSALVGASTYVFDSASGFMAPETGKDPVVLVHGYGAIASDITAYINWAFYYAKLKADGFDVYVIPLSEGGLQDVKKSAAELSAFVQQVLAKTGAQKVDIVCHSEGGLVSRYFIQKLGGASFVDDLITISTPHRGTSVSAIGPGEAARQMEIASAFLTGTLNGLDTTPGGLDYTAVFSNDDKTVFPPENAYFDGALNLNVNGYDHATILFNDEVYKMVKNALGLNVGHAENQLPVRINTGRASMVTSNPGVVLNLNYYNHNAPSAAPGQMKVSNNKTLDGAQWQPVTNTLNWTLDASSNGLKAVYVKYISADGIESPVYVDYMLLDRTPPTAAVIAQPVPGAAGSANLLISAADNTDKYSRLTLTDIRESYGIVGAGARDMMISSTPDFSGAAWEPIADSKQVSLQQDAKIYVKVRDASGNISDAVIVSLPANSVTSGETTVTATIQLDKGWNLIHIPAGLPDTVRNALLDISGRGGSIFDLGNKEFKSLADAWNAAGGANIWMNAASPISRQLTFTAGVSSGPSQIALQQGWNIIGTGGFAAVPVSGIKVVQGAEKISLDAAAQAGLVGQAIIEYSQDKYASADTLQPLRAYLIRAYKPCILVIQ